VLVMNEFLTVEEVANRLRVSTDTVIRRIKRKELAAHKIGGVYRISEADLQKYLDANRTDKEESK
jgi:excisionase family DNA binding protein